MTTYELAEKLQLPYQRAYYWARLVVGTQNVKKYGREFIWTEEQLARIRAAYDKKHNKNNK